MAIVRTKGGDSIVSVEIVTQDHYAWAYTYGAKGMKLFEGYSADGGPRPRVKELGKASALHGALHTFKASAKRQSSVAVSGEILVRFSQRVDGAAVELRTFRVPVVLKNDEITMPHVFIDLKPPL